MIKATFCSSNGKYSSVRNSNIVFSLVELLSFFILYSHFVEPTKDISVVSANTEIGKFALLFKETLGGSDHL